MESFDALTPLLLIFWLLIVPLLAGLSFSSLLPRERQTIPLIWFLGLLASFVLFEPVAVICMIRIVYASFARCVAIYATLMLLLAAAGAARAVIALRRRGGRRGMSALCAVFPGYQSEEVADLLHPRRDSVRVGRSCSRSELLYAVTFLILLGLQLVLAVVLAPFDGDDAYYIVESVQAQQTDTMYTLLPYTGYSTDLDYRHAMAAWPLWLAFIARMGRVHVTIFAHTILPLLLIPCCYYVFAHCGRLLLGRRRDLLPLFLCFLCLFMIFGNVSIYTPETFFLMRTWQGKAMIGNLILPALFWVFLLLAGQEQQLRWRTLGRRERLFPWLLLFLVNVSAGFFSTSGILLVTMLTAAGALFVAAFSGRVPKEERGGAVLRHKAGILVLAGAACVPNAVLVLLGLLMKPF